MFLFCKREEINANIGDHPLMTRTPTSIVVAAAMATLAGVTAAGCDGAASSPGGQSAGPWSGPKNDTNWWLDVHSSPRGRFAVGGLPSEGAIMRHSGTRWDVVSVGTTVPLLNWITAEDDGTLTVVGNAGTVLRSPSDAQWTLEPTPTTQDLWGVAPTAAGELIAVGGTGRDDGVATVLRRRGGEWQAEPLPTLTRPGVRAFFKVWAGGPDDVWVVGQSGAVLHYDGAQWEERHAGTDRDLIAVWGVASDRVVMVGGRGNGVVVFWDGASFRTVDVAPIAGLNGVWMRNRDVVHAVGLFGTVLTMDFLTAGVPDGAGGLRGIVETTLETSHDLHAIHGGDAATGGQLTVVGGNLAVVDGPYEGSVFERQLGDAE
ncbi:MAG: hypothetical protein IV100_05410 [Myxococcales bacterium]|nr:hypothetical protein [Myxococcales bacterium]